MTVEVLRVPGDYYIDVSSGSMTINITNAATTGTLTVIGNINILGQTSQIQTVNSVIQDNIITLNYDEINNYVTAGTSGILISRGNDNSISNAATMLFNDISTTPSTVWTDNSATVYEGLFDFSVAGAGSAIRISAIRVNSTGSTLNIFGVENPSGMMNVKGTVDYELRVVDDDDIPNKKYVDDARYSSTIQAQRIQYGNTLVYITDPNSSPTIDGQPNPLFGPSSIIGALGTSTNVVFQLQGTTAQIQGITINNNAITANNGNLSLGDFASQANINIEGPLALVGQGAGFTPTTVTNESIVYYAGADGIGGGGTGLYFVNTRQKDELVSRRKAIIYAIIF
jgi:hypothetical protein